MKAVVDQDGCVGCGLCADTCPEVFEMEDGVATVIGDSVPVGAEESCEEATSACPVDAISIEE